MAGFTVRPWVVLGGAALLGVVVVAGTAGASAYTVYRSATAAQSATLAIAEGLTSNDYPAAEAAVVEARANIDRAGRAARNPAVLLLGRLPWLGQPFIALGTLTQAGDALVSAAEELLGVYALASGEGVGATKVVLNGQVSIDRLMSYQPALAEAHASLLRAGEAIEDTPTGGPGGERIATLAAQAQAEIVPLADLLGGLLQLYPQLPSLLGAHSPARYLVVVLNPAELRATGGAPLSAALIEVDDGAIEVLRQGATSTEFFQDNRKVTWQTLVGPPLGPPPGEPDRFVNANQHPDFRISGEQLARAWQAGGLPAVDGVIALDTAAVAGVLGVTGPIQTEGYGQISAENLAETVLIDAYAAVRDKSTRHDLNAELASAVMATLTTGENLPGVGRSLLLGGTGRHVQAWLVDPQAQQVLGTIGLAGAVDREAPDQIAVFTQNTNGSKVDVYQQREVRHEVVLSADGSATITQRVTLNNASPGPAGGVPGERRDGYYTRWSRPAVLQYLPTLAFDAAVELPAEWEGEIVADDGQGRPFARARGWIEPGGIITVTLRYRLPAGTFLSDGDALRYSAVADPQPMFTSPSLVLTLTFPEPVTPSGIPAGWGVRGPTVELITAFTTRLEIAVPVPPATGTVR